MVARHLRANVQAALADTRVVVVLGARQVGKSTLVAQIAEGEPDGRLIITLDDEARRRGAIEDPTGFVADLDTPVAIDEVQRAPGLLLAIKQSVDIDQRPGRYLLTGSANILTAPTIADALTGRAEYLRLWPFSQAELRVALESAQPARQGAQAPHCRQWLAGVSAQRERRACMGRSSDRWSVVRDVCRDGDRAPSKRRSRSAACLSLS